MKLCHQYLITWEEWLVSGNPRVNGFKSNTEWRVRCNGFTHIAAYSESVAKQKFLLAFPEVIILKIE